MTPWTRDDYKHALEMYGNAMLDYAGAQGAANRKLAYDSMMYWQELAFSIAESLTSRGY